MCRLRAIARYCAVIRALLLTKSSPDRVQYLCKLKNVCDLWHVATSYKSPWNQDAIACDIEYG